MKPTTMAGVFCERTVLSLFCLLGCAGQVASVNAASADISVVEKIPTPAGMRVVFSLKEPRIALVTAPNGKVFTRLSLEGAASDNEVGRPALPSIRYSGPVPPGVKVTARIQEKQMRELRLSHPIWPQQKPVPKLPGAREQAEFVQDVSFYSGPKATEYQKAWAGDLVVNQHRRRGQDFVEIIGRPFAYHAREGRLRYPAELVLELTYTMPELPRVAGPRPGPIVVLSMKSPSAEALVWLTRHGYNFERREDGSLEIFATEAEAQELRETDFVVEEVLGKPAPPATGGKGLGIYHTHATLTSELQNYGAAFPDRCQLFSIGQSVQGRDLWAMKITTEPASARGKPRVRLAGSMHGDEPLGAELCLYFIDLLLHGSQTNSRIARIVDTTEIWVIPLLNPDGRESNSRFNAAGYDLNRSFPDGGGGGLGNALFGPPPVLSGRPPEVAAMMRLATNYVFTLAANFHGGALVVNYPYDDDELGSVNSPTPDDELFRVVSRAYSSNNPPMWASAAFPQGIVNGAAWYTMDGGMQDWYYRYTGCNEVTIEASVDKTPAANLLPQYWEQNKEALLAFVETLNTRVSGRITDALSGSPLVAAAVVAGNEHAVFSDSRAGDYHRMLLPGTYTIHFTAPGYHPTTVSNVAVQPGEATMLDVALTPAERPQEGILFVTSESLRASLPALRTRKEAEGFMTREVVVPNGAPTNRVRSAIREVFSTFPADYIILVGDVEHVPAFQDTITSAHPTDLPYALFDAGEWLPDYRGRDSILARISLKTPPSIDEFTRKLAAFHASHTNRTGDLTWISNGNNASEYAQAERGHNYCISNAVPPFYNNTRYFEGIGSAVEFTEHVNTGTDAAIYSGHGGEFQWVRWNYGLAALAGLSNLIHVPVIIGHCCVSGSFDEDVCFGEGWLQTTARGVAYVGATDNTYWDEDEWMQMAEFDAMAASSRLSIGRAVEAGLVRVHELSPAFGRYYYSAYHILGDPTAVMLETAGQPLTVVSDSVLETAMVDVPYTHSLRVFGGTPPYMWSVVNGILPEGLTLSPAGIMTGTPIRPCTNHFTVEVRDSSPTTQVASVMLTLAVEDLNAGLNAALETTGWTWNTGGDVHWRAQTAVTHDGEDAAQSGRPGDRQTSWLETVVQGPGRLAFWWKVSSESNYDFLLFHTNDVAPFSGISGETEWTQKTLLLGPGPQRLRWSYAKDESVSNGADVGWVDQVAFLPPSSWPTILTQPRSTVVDAGANASFSAEVQGAAPWHCLWYYHNQVVAHGDTPVLHISNAQPAQAGAYSLVVSNAYGAVTSAPATLWVVRSADLRTNIVSSPAAISIPLLGIATPYPSSNLVSGLRGLIRSVIVSLNGLTHTYAGDLDVLLQAPSGTPVILMGRAGGGSSLNNAAIVFDDQASSLIPALGLTSGTYRPTDWHENSLPLPAPPRPYATNLADLAATEPNGAWRLFVHDAAPGDEGIINAGWTLSIVTFITPVSPRLSEVRVEDGIVRFALPTEPDRGYVIEWSDTLTPDSWRPLHSFLGDGLVRTFSHACGSAVCRFYRVRLE